MTIDEKCDALLRDMLSVRLTELCGETARELGYMPPDEEQIRRLNCMVAAAMQTFVDSLEGTLRRLAVTTVEVVMGPRSTPNDAN